MAFNPQQQKAIDDRGHTLLVSAAAGSGKTSVLIERMIRRITDAEDPVSIDEILCVTFTKSAAAEIRARLTRSLTEAVEKEPHNKRLLRQLAISDSARIETIDSFFLDVVRKNFDKAGLPAAFSVMDEEESKIFCFECCEETLDELYESESADSAFFDLVENFSTLRSDGNLNAFLCELYGELVKKPDPVKYLESSIDIYSRIAAGNMDFMDSPWGEALRQQMRFDFGFALERLEGAFEKASESKNFDEYTELLENFRRIVRLVDEKAPYEQLYQALRSVTITKKKFGADKEKSDAAFVFKRYASDAKNAKPLFCCDAQTLKHHACEYARLIAKTLEIFLKLDAKISEKKRQKAKLDFSDMPRLCLKLLFEKKDGRFIPTPLCRSIALGIKELYIDEYQDTNELQDMIFSALSESADAPRFMVGDVKQCIYAFRGSKPSTFTDYYDSFDDAFFEEGGKNRKINLSLNYRSDPAVIDTANAVFSRLMTKRLGEVDYDEDAMLRVGKSKDSILGLPAKLLTVDLCGDEKKTEARRKQLSAVADEIVRLLDSGLSADGKKYLPSDIAVLYRSGAEYALLAAQELEKRGIPTCSKRKRLFFGEAHIGALISVLHAIDNPASDVHLACAMSSPLFNFDLTELLEIKDGSDMSLYDCLNESELPSAKAFREKLFRYRTLGSTLGVRELIHEICLDSGYDTAVLGAVGEKGVSDIYRLCSLATEEEAYDLSAFLKKTDRLSESLVFADEDGGGVTVSTIHNSKGLEYKICFIVGLEDSVLGKTSDSLVSMAGGFPPSFPLRHRSGFAVTTTLPFTVSAYFDKYLPLSEETRILYVAMTRAKERLYLCTSGEAEKREELVLSVTEDEDPCSQFRMYNVKSRFEWIVRALSAVMCPDTLHRFLCLGEKQSEAPFIDSVKIGNGDSEMLSESEIKASPKCCAQGGRADYVYPFIEDTKAPAKLSVSDIAKKEAEFAFSHSGAKSRRPAFLGGEAGGTEVGNAMHAFMQFCDFGLAKKDGAREADRLVSLYHLTKEQRELLDLKKISEFFSSELYEKMTRAQRLYREKRFNLPVGDRDGVLLQGVIDCFFIDEQGDAVLLDFKTDRIRQGEEQMLISRYAEQLRHYADAVTAMTGKPVKKAYLYSFALSKAIETELSE